MPRIKPPKPPSRPDNAGVLARLKLFRKDMFRSQPDRLYDARMAQIKTPFVDSVLINDPPLISEILEKRAADFPKAGLIGDTLRPLLGHSVFVTNGKKWAQQRSLIDPAFAAGRVRESFTPMRKAVDHALEKLSDGPVEIEYVAAHLAADIIFRTLFSVPISEAHARETFEAFRAYQRAQPIFSPFDLIGAPKWIPRKQRGKTYAARIRVLLGELVAARSKKIRKGTAPGDLATKIMTARDPDSGIGFTDQEMVDQVAIFFLAGHETSASAIAWGLYCLASDQEAQDEVLHEINTICPAGAPRFSDIPKLRFTRNVFREVLRLYPPVPMMVRETSKPEVFRKRELPSGSLAILSPWHMHRHRSHWDDPDVFDPWRWDDEATRRVAQDCYYPFSKGPRVCPGAGFATVEGVLALAMFVREFQIAPTAQYPIPVAHLTVRSEAGINLALRRRSGPDTTPE